MVIIAIFSSLFLGQPLVNYFGNQNLQATLFLIVLILVGATIIVHALNTKPSKIEFTVWLGMLGVYIMLILRLGLPERSHLVEYSVLAIFTHMAISEGMSKGKLKLKSALLAFILSFFISVCDECIQLFLPNRVFDTEDILFNVFAITMALGTSLFITWIRKLIDNNMESTKY